jgi:hypothetical protein
VWSSSLFKAATTALILSVYVALLVHPINMTVGDLGRHLKNGELVIRDGLIAGTNLFSYMEPNYPFINHHWGSGVIFYLIEQISGFYGLSLAFIVISAVTVWIFLDLSSRYSSFPVAAIIAVVCLPILITRYEVRPELFTYLLSGLYLQILWGYRRRRFGFRVLCWLPVLQLFWVNLHIYFFFGILLTTLYLFEPLIEQLGRKSAELDRRIMGPAAIWLLTLLASCVNPAGVHGALYPFSIMKGYEFPVLENYSVNGVLGAGFNFLPLPYFLIILGLLSLSWLYVLARDRPSFSYANLLLSVFVTAVAWWSIRNFALFAYIAMPLSAFNLKNFMTRARGRSSWTGIRTSGALAAAAIILFLISPVYFVGGGRGAFGIGLKKGNGAAGDFLNSEKLQGPIFNNFDVSGYLIYYLYPKQRVFVDNRPEAYPPSFFRNEYFRSLEDEDYWTRRSREIGFNTIVFNHRDRSTASAQFIIRRVLDPKWVPVFFDDSIIILVNRYGPNPSTVAKFALPKERILERSN